MTVEDRNIVLETVDILRALGGNNGFTNLQPRFKKTLLGYASKLNKIVEKDIQFVKENYNLDVNDDEADAICIGYSCSHDEETDINWE